MMIRVRRPQRIALPAAAGATMLAGLFAVALGSGGERATNSRSPAWPVRAAAHPGPDPRQEPPERDPAVLAAGLSLESVMGAGALIAVGDAGERFVRVGQPVAPGLVLGAVHVDHVILHTEVSAFRLDLGRFGASAGGAKLVAAESRPSPRPSAAPAGQKESVAYRLGLAPRKENDRITGYRIRANAQLPALQKAGLQSGDVLVAVNGQPLISGEKIEELPREIAGSWTAEFEFERNGRKMKALLEVNPRP